MKKLAILALTLAAPAIADSYIVIGLPAVSCSSSVGVEVLYWKPCYQQSEYASLEIPGAVISDEGFSVNPNYEWGFRLFGAISNRGHCNFASLEWAHIHGTTSASVRARSGETLTQLPLSRTFQHVVASQQTGYDKVVLRLGHQFCHNIYAYIGGRYAQASYRLSSRGVDPIQAGQIADSTWFSRFTGGGLEAGLSATYEVGCGFGLCARVGAFGLLSEKRMRHRTELTTTGVINRKMTSGRRCVGGYDFRIGVNYTHQCGCCCLSGDVGYEYDQYIGGLLLRHITATGGNSDIITDANFGMGGVYFGLTVGF